MSLMGAYCLGLVMSGEVGHRSIPVETKIAVGMAYYRRADFKPGKICEVINKKWSSEYITKLKRGDYEYPDSKKLPMIKELFTIILYLIGFIFVFYLK